MGQELEARPVPTGSPLERATSSGAAMEATMERLARAKEFVRRNFKEGVHFGTPFGNEEREDGKGQQQGGDYKKKKMLYQPGGDLLLKFHGYVAVTKAVEANCVRDWQAPFFAFEHETNIIDTATGEPIGNGMGAANSQEPAFAGRWISEKKLSVDVDRSNLKKQERKSKFGNGTYCVYWVPTPPEEKFGQMNSVMKRSVKRSKVAAAIQACAIAADFIVGDDDEHAEEPEEAGAEQGKKEAPKPEVKQTPGCITEGQGKLIYARLKDAGLGEEDLKDYMAASLPYTKGADGKFHRGAIKADDLNPLLEWIAGQKAAGAAQ